MSTAMNVYSLTIDQYIQYEARHLSWNLFHNHFESTPPLAIHVESASTRVCTRVCTLSEHVIQPRNRFISRVNLNTAAPAISIASSFDNIISSEVRFECLEEGSLVLTYCMRDLLLPIGAFWLLNVRRMARIWSFFWTKAAVCLCLQAICCGVLRADPVRFTYGDVPTGPAHWGDLNVNWTNCKTGQQQSPIKITPEIMVVDPELGELDSSYSFEPVPANISINVGYAVEVNVDSNVGLLKINGGSYRPAQFHFHMGSEHKILGHSFPMELHQVYVSEEDAKLRAVVAWLFVKGAENKFLAQFDGKLPTPSSSPTEFMLDPIDLPTFQKSYARYEGSLTTPPCTENVTWTVMLWNFPTISEHQIQLFKKAMPITNVRPSSPSNGRKFRINYGYM